MRRSVQTLRVAEPPFRLAAALDDLVREVDDERMSVTLGCAGDECGHDPDRLTVLYRAAQEGLTNARRHSGAGRVSVTVRCDPSRLRLVVADDGRGFPPGQEGYGLLGMRERVQLTGGTVEVDSGPGRGTRLTGTIPSHLDGS